MHLLFTVRFLDDRYHGLEPDGRPEWPPSPARFYQALVASAARGAAVAKEDNDALEWLEQLDPPVIAAPIRHKGQSFKHFMLNNDLDTVSGNPARTAAVRSATKRFHPQVFDSEVPFLYVWSFEHSVVHAERMLDLASRLYQLGRGVDMAWAVAEILDAEKTEARLAVHPGAVHRPANKGNGQGLACPQPGSLKSLIERYEKSKIRFKTVFEAAPTEKEPSRLKVAGQTFSQPPKPKFSKISYNSPPVRRLYELRDMMRNAGFFVWPFRDVVRLVESVRNSAAERLREALPEKLDAIEHVFGLRRDATETDKSKRIRIIPLPSVGHQYADHGIRRLLVEIPSCCPLAAKDIEWAFAMTRNVDRTTGEIRWMLVAAEDYGMLEHYGIGVDNENKQDAFRVWRTVTPMALPAQRLSGQKIGAERSDTENMAAAAVVQAVRHAGIAARPSLIRVQREPFDAKGVRAEDFAPGTRFASGRLWHVELTFDTSLAGPLLAGDGRYLGLGVMKPVKVVVGVHAFRVVTGLMQNAEAQSIARALRRAVMARVQGRIGRRAVLPTFFSGHEADGAPARRGGRSHLAFVFDADRQRLLIIAPHLLERRNSSTYEESNHLEILDVALADLSELRAGSAGLLKLEPLTIADDDPLFANAATWTAQTEYFPTRYSKKTTPEQTIIADVELELRRRGLPTPTNIETISVTSGPRGGLSARLRVAFSTAVRGPLIMMTS